MEINVFGISAVAFTIGLVEYAKKFGAAGKVCDALSMLFGVLLVGLNAFATAPAGLVIDASFIIKNLVEGVIVGLVASGAYDLSKNFRPQ